MKCINSKGSSLLYLYMPIPRKLPFHPDVNNIIAQVIKSDIKRLFSKGALTLA